MSDLLKTVIQDLINDRTDQAQVSIHEYLVSKMQELSGLTEAKMKFPGCKVTMLQSWKDKLEKAIKKLGFDIEQRGYTDGSTSWTVAFATKRGFNLKKFENDLREELDFDGFLDVRAFDLVEEAKKPVRFTPTFKKITSYDEFERLEGDSDQFFETEMDGKTVMVAAGKDGVITGVWYNKAKSGSMSPDFAKSARPKDEESYMEQDTQWPYGD